LRVKSCFQRTYVLAVWAVADRLRLTHDAPRRDLGQGQMSHRACGKLRESGVIKTNPRQCQGSGSGVEGQTSGCGLLLGGFDLSYNLPLFRFDGCGFLVFVFDDLVCFATDQDREACEIQP
jgi:hypothetical protein